jgi:hypothetical protein
MPAAGTATWPPGTPVAERLIIPAGRSVGDHHTGQRGRFALAHEPAVLTDQEPPAVAGQAPGLDWSSAIKVVS